MELLNPPLRNRALFSNFSIKTISSKNTFKLHISTSKKPHKNPSIPSYLPFCASINSPVSAYFGRHSSRRNSLRKKLVNDHQQVSQRNLLSLSPTFDDQKPCVKFDNIDNSVENLDYDCVKESDFSYGFGSDNVLVESDGMELRDRKGEKLGDSVLLSKLEKWVDQYKKDAAFWGIGYSPVFTVFHDFEGNVKRVLVNEDEILKRSQIKKGEFEVTKEVNSKVLYAKGLAREMERGGNVIPRNSSVAKFVVLGEETGFVNTVCSVVNHPEFGPVLSRVGKLMFCGVVAIWAVKMLFSFGRKDIRSTELEKEMMRRKIKSRKEKEVLEKGNVQIVQEPLEPLVVLSEKPKMDKEELMKQIYEAQASENNMLSVNSFNPQITKASDFDEKIQKIRAMARKAREIEGREQSMANKDGEGKLPMNENLPKERQVVEEHAEDKMSFQNTNSGSNKSEILVKPSLVKPENDNSEYHHKVTSEDNMQASTTAGVDSFQDGQKMLTQEVVTSRNTTVGESCMSKNGSIRKKPGFIRSVKEAREYLAKKGGKHDKESHVNMLRVGTPSLRKTSDEVSGGKTSQRVDCEDFTPKEKKFIPKKNGDSKNFVEQQAVNDSQDPLNNLNHETNVSTTERRNPVRMDSWVEKNFHEVEPIVKRIGDGFRDNYKVAKQKVSQRPNVSSDITLLNNNKDESEFEWMKDDSLREIVFQVRDNELAGRDPFHLLDVEDKLKFFKGLENKVEKENKKLLQVHEYLHSNIENLDYGADGISLYDPPEKFIPRWKGPPLEKNHEFLNNFHGQQNAVSARNAGTSYPVKKDAENFSQKSTESPVNENPTISAADYALNKSLHDRDPKGSKTIIEGSDGSIRAGKKTGKEYWQHTKKWSRGFLESYNAETDPETKSIMKDIGKDLDRWITEEEVQEAADMMTKLPEKNKKFIEKKISKLKRELELFGPQAVVSKYREYAEEKEDDYLWWLDLPHILCVELYTIKNGEQKIGFYSLEMAADMELEPKPCHVIAFEDAGDCKNLCYIIQAHMDMLGNGHAFVVPRLPKDAFREAKANGFGVTVIRKGELQLNVDQTLEEVEEEITEIGSKVYHDKLTQERSVDINSLMKGVFSNSSQSTNTKRKRSKQMLKKHSKK